MNSSPPRSLLKVDCSGVAAFSIALLFSTASVHAQEAGASSSANTQESSTEPAHAGADLEAGTVPVPQPPPDAMLPQVEPIIGEEEFNSSIPSLGAEDDPELDRPLESIEAFERRLAAEQAGAQPGEGAQPPLGEPALSDADTSEEIGDAPVRDAELTAPLPPIDRFEVTPVELPQTEADDKEDVGIPYKVRIEGLKTADDETGKDLKDEFDSLSALGRGDGKAANAAMISARLTEDSELMQNILASEGWYSPIVRTRLDSGGEGEEPALTAVITVNPGKRYVLSDIVIDADPTVPPNLIADNLALKVGEPIVAERVQGAEAKVAVTLPESGYPFATVGERDILLDRDTGEGIYTLPVDIGPRGRFGSITTEGDQAFGADHIKVLTRFKRGDLYDSRKVDDLRKALVATSLFSAVSVEPRKTGEPAGDGTEYVTLHVNQDAGPPRTIAGSLGYAAGEGITAEATWTHRNLFPPEGALIAHLLAGTQQQGAGVTFRRSNAGKRDRTVEVVAEAFHNDYEAYSAYTGRLAAKIARDSTPIWQKKFTYAYGVELLATGETDFNADTGTRDRRTYYIAGVSGQAGFDRSNDLLDPTKGYRLTALVQPEATVNKGFDPYVRARLDASAYYSVTDQVVLAGRVRVGSIQGVGLFDIAPSRRFYAGGGGSVRGFAYQKLGEQAPDGKPVGGRSLNEASAELRYRFGNYGIVGFIDAGQAYRETMPQFSDLRYGVGLGGRFYTNFGPVRLDVATPLARKKGESRINIYVSIGQAF